MHTHVSRRSTEALAHVVVCLVLTVLAVGCGAGKVRTSKAAPTAPEVVRTYPTTRRGFLDSLGTLATYADVSVPIQQATVDGRVVGVEMAAADRCALVAAALRAAAAHAPIPPLFDPSEVVRVRTASVSQTRTLTLGTDGQIVHEDTVMSVGLDIPDRRHWAIFTFDNARRQVELSFVHR